MAGGGGGFGVEASADVLVVAAAKVLEVSADRGCNKYG